MFLCVFFLILLVQWKRAMSLRLPRVEETLCCDDCVSGLQKFYGMGVADSSGK